jgi:hypothetical protein
MSFLNDVRPIKAIKELRFVFDQSPKERLIAGFLALLFPAIIFTLFAIDSKVNTAAPDIQEIVYIENWALTRTDEEILKDRWEIQCLKDKFEAERRENMKKLGRMSGMDVDKIEQEAEAAKAARGEVEVERPAGLTC